MRNLLLASALAGVTFTILASPAAPRGPATFSGARIDNPGVLPNLTLRDQDNHRVSLSALRGKVVLVTFLYTHCKDVCPLTAQNLSAAVGRLGSSRSDVRVLAISVDPHGDTPASVREFVRSHRLVPQFRYLIGSKAELTPIWRAYSVTSVERAKGDIDHTLYTVLADRKGIARVLYDATATSAAVAHDLRLLLDT